MSTESNVKSLDWNAAKSHLKDVEDYLRTFAGKEGCNPFMVIRDKINPLKSSLESKTFSDKDTNLYAAIMALQKVEPKIVVTIESRLPQPLIVTATK